MRSFLDFLKDPFDRNGNMPLSAWRLFLVVGLIVVLLAGWGLVFRAISFAAEKID
jgi:hypothetical protein